MGKPGTHKITFTASIEEVPRMCESITEAARNAGMQDRNLWKLETAVDEALTNICCYGYQCKQDGKIWINWETEGGFFCLTIEDTGIPFDQTQPTTPNFTQNICDRKIGGLGRHIMRNFLDDMKYKYNGERNCLTLIKSLQEEKKAAVS